MSQYPYFKTYSLITLIPIKMISFYINALLPLTIPLLEALFKGCLLNHSQFIFCICNNALYHLNSLGIIFIWGKRNSPEEIAQTYMEVVKGQELNDLPRTFESTRLCKQVLWHDGGAMFLQSTFFVIFFLPHPSYASELPN
jgi:hypothetical protein